MARQIPNEYDSKFRFIVVASQRAKQLQNGDPPKLRVKSEKPAYIAVREAEANLVKYKLIAFEDGTGAEEESPE